MGNKRLLRSQRDKEGLSGYDVRIDEDAVQDIHVEGYAGQIFGLMNSITNFYVIGEVETEKDGGQIVEQRLIKYRIHMPTLNFIEMCANTLMRAAERSEEFDGLIDNYRTKLKELLPIISKEKPQ